MLNRMLTTEKAAAGPPLPDSLSRPEDPPKAMTEPVRLPRSTRAIRSMKRKLKRLINRKLPIAKSHKEVV